jgi:hypothetical protein
MNLGPARRGYRRGVDRGNLLPAAAFDKLIVNEEAQWLSPLLAVRRCKFNLHVSNPWSAGEIAEAHNDQSRCFGIGANRSDRGPAGRTQPLPSPRGSWQEGGHLMRIPLDPSSALPVHCTKTLRWGGVSGELRPLPELQNLDAKCVPNLQARTLFPFWARTDSLRCFDPMYVLCSRPCVNQPTLNSRSAEWVVDLGMDHARHTQRNGAAAGGACKQEGCSQPPQADNYMYMS